MECVLMSPALLLSLWLVAPPPRPVVARPPAELRKLHVLVVLDTAGELRKQLEVDEIRLTRCLRERIPRDRYELKLLKGKEVTRERILKACRELKAGPDDGVLFYYAGAGGGGVRQSQLLKLHNGKPLYRTELRRALEAKKAGLVILLTDFCQRTVVDNAKSAMPERPAAESMNATMRCLLFQARGIVDITAAGDGHSAGDTREGGLFTYVLCRLIWQDIKTLDTNKDGFVDWQEFFECLKKETESQFSNWSNGVRARGKSVKGVNARPVAFALAQNPGNSTFAVVALTNGTERTLALRYRWYGEGIWTLVRLPAGEKRVLHVVVAGLATPLPRLEVQVDGISKVQYLPAERWSGPGEPSWKDGKRYRISPRREER
jgi:hypothetical protein